MLIASDTPTYVLKRTEPWSTDVKACGVGATTRWSANSSTVTSRVGPTTAADTRSSGTPARSTVAMLTKSSTGRRTK
jgi:hypothetical protein